MQGLLKKIQANKSFSLLDREYINEIKKEHNLATILNYNKEESIMLGCLLRADIIVLINIYDDKKKYAMIKVIDTNLGIRLIKKIIPVESLDQLELDLQNQISIINTKSKISENARLNLGVIGFGSTNKSQKISELKRKIEYALVDGLNNIDHVFMNELVNLNNIRDENLLHLKNYSKLKLDNFIYGNIDIDEEAVSFRLSMFDNHLVPYTSEFKIDLNNIDITLKRVIDFIVANNKYSNKEILLDTNKQSDAIIQIAKFLKTKNEPKLVEDFYQAAFSVNPNNEDAIVEFISNLNSKIAVEINLSLEKDSNQLIKLYSLEIERLNYCATIIKNNLKNSASNFGFDTNYYNKFRVDYYDKCPKNLISQYDEARFTLLKISNLNSYPTDLYYQFKKNDAFTEKALAITHNATKDFPLLKRIENYKKILIKMFPKYDETLTELYDMKSINKNPLFSACLYSHLFTLDFTKDTKITEEKRWRYSSMLLDKCNQFFNSEEFLKLKDDEKIEAYKTCLVALFKNSMDVIKANLEKLQGKENTGFNSWLINFMISH